MLSEEAFKSQCGEVYNSNLLGEDQSEIVNCIIQGDKTLNKLPSLVAQARDLNINNSQFYSANKDWIMHEIQKYME